MTIAPQETPAPATLTPQDTDLDQEFLDDMEVILDRLKGVNAILATQ